MQHVSEKPSMDRLWWGGRMVVNQTWAPGLIHYWSHSTKFKIKLAFLPSQWEIGSATRCSVRFENPGALAQSLSQHYYVHSAWFLLVLRGWSGEIRIDVAFPREGRVNQWLALYCWDETPIMALAKWEDTWWGDVNVSSAGSGCWSAARVNVHITGIRHKSIVLTTWVPHQQQAFGVTSCFLKAKR